MTDKNHKEQPAKKGSTPPYDENLLERSRTQWQFGDWQSLAQMQRETLQHHPDRAKLALLAAAGHLQSGSMDQARQYVRLARDWGCDKQLVSRILIAGVHNSLGRAAAMAGKQPKALDHFERAVAIGTPGGDVRLLTTGRTGEQLTQIGLRHNFMQIDSYACRNRSHLALRWQDVTQRGSIIIAGMRHSGSTAIFNIVRLALEKKKIIYSGFYSEHYKNPIENLRDGKLLLIKTHELRDDVACSNGIVITARRDLRDTVASAVRRGFALEKQVGGAVEYAKYNRSLHDIWIKRSDYVFIYEDFIKDPLGCTARLLKFLGLNDVDHAEIYDELCNVPVDDYKNTLLSPTHITDPDRKLSFYDTLKQDQIDIINRHHNSWLRQYGYMG